MTYVLTEYSNQFNQNYATETDISVNICTIYSLQSMPFQPKMKWDEKHNADKILFILR